MEIFFENPGHREGLVELGVLDKGQVRITAKDLIKKVLESKNIEMAFYILRQELATYHTGLLFLDIGIEMAEKEIKEIKDPQTLETATFRVNSIHHTLRRAALDRKGLVYSTILIARQTELTQSMSENLQAVNKMDTEMLEILQKNGDYYVGIAQKLQEELSKFI